jgi:hypothetical protein
MSGDLGTLVVVVLKAKDLPDKHTFSKQCVMGCAFPWVRVGSNNIDDQRSVRSDFTGPWQAAENED